MKPSRVSNRVGRNSGGDLPGFEHHENDAEKQERVAFLKRLERIDSIVREYTRRYSSKWISIAREEQPVRRDLTALYRNVAGPLTKKT